MGQDRQPGHALYFPAIIAEHPERVIAPIRAITNADEGCVVFHCASGKDRTGLLALVLLVLAGATPGEIVADHLLSYAWMRERFEEAGHGDQLAAVTRFLADRGTTIEASLLAAIEAAHVFLDTTLPDALSTAELTALRVRLTQRGS
ncbi:hypothetical protein GCM10029964_008800 [Kibdelosporangium lantanae]